MFSWLEPQADKIKCAVGTRPQSHEQTKHPICVAYLRHARFLLEFFTSRQDSWPFPSKARLPVAFSLSYAYGIIHKKKKQ